mgnify:CR=1 FL=1
MARRATAIKQERAQNEGIVLVLDAGNALLGQSESVTSPGQLMVQAMNAMGYDAMALGEYDLAGGLAVVKECEERARFPFLAANLVTTGDNQLIVRPYVVLARGGAHFGILGLTDPGAKEVLGEHSGATVLDPLQVASHYVPELRAKVDVLIVLSSLGLEGDKALAAAVPGIDIIIGGTSHTLMNKPERVGNTLIVQQGYSGEWLGRLEVTYDAGGQPVRFTEEVMTLTDDFPDDQEIAALVEKWKALYPTPTLPPTPTPPPGS